MSNYRTPGVYIEELPATGPIAGVGTSTGGFIGPALSGPLFTPTKVTNWTQFKDVFGEYIVSPRQYLAYAVRSFFENGGTTAYVVRVGTAVRAFKDVPDRGTAGTFAFRAVAKAEGTQGNGIALNVADAQIVTAARVLKARAQGSLNAAKDVVTLVNINDASKFAVGDVVTLESGTERVAINRVLNDQVFLAAPLTGTYTGTQWIRIANLVPGQRRFRVVQGAGLEAGSATRLSDNQTPTPAQQDAVVSSVSSDWVTLDAALTQTFLLGDTDPNVTVQSFEFDLTISKTGFPQERYDDLATDARHSRYWRTAVASSLVDLMHAPQNATTQAPPSNRPTATTHTTGGGQADTLPPTQSNYERGIAEFERVDDVNFIAIPDRRDASVQGKLVAHCEQMRDRFALLDSQVGETPFDPLPTPSVVNHRGQLSSARGYGAIYYPWVQITDPASPAGDERIFIPPSGAVAGIYARSDEMFGVHKAPANEEIRNAIGLERSLTDTEHGELNVEGVNVIRLFPGIGRPVVWGARTIAPRDATAYRYVNVRRLLLYIEESLQEGLRPFVFDPNDLGLWKRLNRTVTEFLTRVWRAGALFGATADQAFYVKIDEENNPEDVRALGQVIVEVGIAPVRPAEFVVVRIGIWAGRSDVNEQ
jgi:uncharacterized protein